MGADILMPALTGTMTEGRLLRWCVSPGDRVRCGDVIARIGVDGTTLECRSDVDGIIDVLLVTPGTASVRVGSPIATTRTKDGASDADAPQPAVTSGTENTAAPRIRASPLARSVAAAGGLDLTGMIGSGPLGRIVLADVETALGRSPSIRPPGPEGPSQPEDAPDSAQRAAASHHNAEPSMARPCAHLHLRRDIRIDRLLEIRHEINRQNMSAGMSLSVTDFVVKACALALQQVPDACAVLTGEPDPSRAGVTIFLEAGAIALTGAEALSLTTLSRAGRDISSRPAEAPDPLGTGDQAGLAVLDLGRFGVESVEAVPQPPCKAVLAIGASLRRPVVSAQGDLAVATILPVSLGIDATVIDAPCAARFLAAVAEALEHPFGLVAPDLNLT